MRLLKFDLLGLLVLAISANQAAAALIWYEYGGHYYARTENLAPSWAACEAEAIAIGGHLAAITSLEEQGFINSTFLSGLGAADILWIGLTDSATEGEFRWTTGEPLIYTNWQPGEPNNAYGTEDYVCINWHHVFAGEPVGTWNDADIAYLRGIAELDFNPLPEPSTFALAGIGALVFLAYAAHRWWAA